MERFDAIQSTWLSQELAAVPSLSDIKGLLKHHIDKERRNFYLTMGVIGIAFLVMLGITLFDESALMSTRIGELMIVVTVLYGGYLKWKTYQKKQMLSGSSLDVNQFLDSLRNEKIESCTGTANQQLTVFSLLSLGYFFFMYESLSVTATRLVIGYSAAVVYLFVAWFVYRPFMIRRRREQVQSLLTKIETIKKEMS